MYQLGKERSSLMLGWSKTEKELYALGHRLIAGVDEAGRGPIAGPVVAAAVVLDPWTPVELLEDSKKLSPSKRQEASVLIRRHARAWSVGMVGAAEIDKMNIRKASLAAMAMALERLAVQPDYVLIDGTEVPSGNVLSRSVVKGDAHVACIAAASILAKVFRDDLMRWYDRIYPGYGLAQHKGYATPQHLDAIHRLGLSPLHRTTFRVAVAG